MKWLLNTESDKRSFFTSLRFGSICGHIICVFDLERNSFDNFFPAPIGKFHSTFHTFLEAVVTVYIIGTVSSKRLLSAFLIQFILGRLWAVLFGQSHINSTLVFCPGQTSQEGNECEVYVF